jgi:hypothetical protein
MTRELILHIGLTKTGSTSIQHLLAASRDKLAAQGVYVPTTPGKISHTLLMASVLEDLKWLPAESDPIWGGIAPATALTLFREAFAAEMAALPQWAERCIITSELMSERLLLDREIERLAAMLSPFFASTRVVVYLRRQDKHAASNYNQFLRAGFPAAPSLQEGWAQQAKMLDYDALLARYARVFGAKAMLPRIFSPEDLVNGDVVNDFLNVTQISLTNDAPRQLNQSINWEGQQLLLAINRRVDRNSSLRRGMPELRQLTNFVANSLQGPGWRPTRHEAANFMARFAQTNELVRLSYFPERASLFSDDFSDLPAEPLRVDLATVLEAAVGVLIEEASERIRRDTAAKMAQFRLLKRLGDTAGMRAVLMRTIQTTPQSAPRHLAARLRMAEICISEGDGRQACEHAEVALRIDPESRRARHLVRQASQSQSPSHDS